MEPGPGFRSARWAVLWVGSAHGPETPPTHESPLAPSSVSVVINYVAKLHFHLRSSKSRDAATVPSRPHPQPSPSPETASALQAFVCPKVEFSCAYTHV